MTIKGLMIEIKNSRFVYLYQNYNYKKKYY